MAERLHPELYAGCTLPDEVVEKLANAFESRFAKLDGFGRRDFCATLEQLITMLNTGDDAIARTRLLNLCLSIGDSSLIVAAECVSEDPRPQAVFRRVRSALENSEVAADTQEIDFCDVGKIGRTQEADEVLLVFMFMNRVIDNQDVVANARECLLVALPGFAIVPGNQWLLRQLWRWFLEEALPAAYCCAPARAFDYRKYLADRERLEAEYWQERANPPN